MRQKPHSQFVTQQKERQPISHNNTYKKEQSEDIMVVGELEPKLGFYNNEN